MRSLRRGARGHMRREGRGHSLQPTVLVHEAYLRLVGADVDWRNRTHFLSVAANVMRRVLVERARTRQARKRGGNELRVTLSDQIAGSQSSPIDLLMLDEAIERLRELGMLAVAKGDAAGARTLRQVITRGRAVQMARCRDRRESWRQGWRRHRARSAAPELLARPHSPHRVVAAGETPRRRSLKHYRLAGPEAF